MFDGVLTKPMVTNSSSSLTFPRKRFSAVFPLPLYLSFFDKKIGKYISNFLAFKLAFLEIFEDVLKLKNVCVGVPSLRDDPCANSAVGNSMSVRPGGQ